VADLIQQLTTSNPDVIVGMERGGAFVADVIAGGSPDLAAKVHKMEAHKNPKAKPASNEKFDAPVMRAQFQELIDNGARKIALVDVYMGGKTASSLRDQIFLRLARDNPGVSFEVHWVRETMGFEKQSQAGGTVLEPRRGMTTPGQPGGDRVRSSEINVRIALGDDMEIVFAPNTYEPITIFDTHGRIVRVWYPKAGQTTRQLLIELLNQPVAGP
jgi:hypothetical protein